VLAITEETAIAYGALRVALKRSGRPIPANDAWIAALAIQHRLPFSAATGTSTSCLSSSERTGNPTALRREGCPRYRFSPARTSSRTLRGVNGSSSQRTPYHASASSIAPESAPGAPIPSALAAALDAVLGEGRRRLDVPDADRGRHLGERRDQVVGERPGDELARHRNRPGRAIAA
jgi:hypothetical protein